MAEAAQLICIRMHVAASMAALLLAAPAFDANAQTNAFDGDWQVTLTCPPHDADGDDAKGYTHHFAAQVVDGQLHGVHGHEGEPGWHDLHGAIRPDGSAALRLDGIVNNPKYAINGAQRGKPYSYRVRAQFETAGGSGQRLTGRACEFRFAR